MRTMETNTAGCTAPSHDTRVARMHAAAGRTKLCSHAPNTVGILHDISASAVEKPRGEMKEEETGASEDDDTEEELSAYFEQTKESRPTSPCRLMLPCLETATRAAPLRP